MEDTVIHAFSFTFVMAVHVIVWRLTFSKIKDDLESSYIKEYTEKEVPNTVVYFKDILLLKQNNVPAPPFSPLQLIVYILFSYLILILVVFLVYCFLSLLIRFVLFNCVLENSVFDNNGNLDPQHNFILQVIKNYLLKHFLELLESVVICVCFIIIISIIIRMFFKPVLLVKENAITIVNVFMWIFLVFIPFTRVVNMILPKSINVSDKSYN